MITNELKVYETNALSKHLAKLSDKVIACYGKIEENFFTIAKILGDIKTQGLYEKDFNTYEEYTKEVFGFKKSFAYELAKIGTKFALPESSHSIFYDEETGKDFKQSQLAVLVRLDVEQVQEGLDNGKITLDSTVKEVREFVSEVKNKKTLEAPEAGAEAPETDEETPEANVETHEVDTEVPENEYRALKAIKEALHKLTDDEYKCTPERPRAILFEMAKLLSNYDF